MINKKVKVKGGVDYIGGWEGVVVGEVGGEGWFVGVALGWEVEFENGESKFVKGCDLDVIE